MALPTLPPLEAAPYRWQRSPTTPGSVRRLANGTEAWVGLREENARGQFDNYLLASMRLGPVQPPSPTSALVSLATLKEHLSAALVELRFRHPEVACTASWKGAGPPHVEYTAPASNAEALAWARGAIRVVADGTGRRELWREEKEKLVRARLRMQVARPAASVTWHLLAPVDDEHAPLPPGVAVDLLGHFNHIFWDGISERACMGDLLRGLGRSWELVGEALLPEHAWGEEIANLAVPILDALPLDVSLLGDDFAETRDEFLSSLLRSSRSWGLNVTQPEVAGMPRTEWYSFSQASSAAMIHAVKTRLGPQFTISHLGHAASVLALLKINPLPTEACDGIGLITPLPVNGRRFLKHALKDGQYGACQAGAVVEFPDLASWTVDHNDHGAVISALKRGCHHIKSSYDYWLGKDHQIAVNVSKDNFLADFLSSTPMPFTGHSIPIFVSDGVVDQYVPSKVTSPTGEVIFDVQDCVFLLDTYGPDVLIRMESFNQKTTLSLCYNDGHFSSDAAASFLHCLAGLMIEFTR